MVDPLAGAGETYLGGKLAEFRAKLKEYRVREFNFDDWHGGATPVRVIEENLNEMAKGGWRVIAISVIKHKGGFERVYFERDADAET